MSKEISIQNITETSINVTKLDIDPSFPRDVVTVNVDFSITDKYEAYVNYYPDLTEYYNNNNLWPGPNNVSGRRTKDISKSQFGREHWEGPRETNNEQRNLLDPTDVKAYITRDQLVVEDEKGNDQERKGRYYDIHVTTDNWIPAWLPINDTQYPDQTAILYRIDKTSNFIWSRNWIRYTHSGYKTSGGDGSGKDGARKWLEHAVKFIARNKTEPLNILIWDDGRVARNYYKHLSCRLSHAGSFWDILTTAGHTVKFNGKYDTPDGANFPEIHVDYDYDAIKQFDVILMPGIMETTSSGIGTASSDIMNQTTFDAIVQWCNNSQDNGIIFFGDHNTYTGLPNAFSEKLYNENIIAEKIIMSGRRDGGDGISSKHDVLVDTFGDIFGDEDAYIEGTIGSITKFIKGHPNSVPVSFATGWTFNDDGTGGPTEDSRNTETKHVLDHSIKARYLRVHVTNAWTAGKNGSWTWGIGRFEAYDENGNGLLNTLPSEAFSASGEYNASHKAEHIAYKYGTDGVPTLGEVSPWSSGQEADKWVQIDLGKVRTITAIGTKPRAYGADSSGRFDYSITYELEYGTNKHALSHFYKDTEKKQSLLDIHNFPEDSKIRLTVDKDVNITCFKDSELNDVLFTSDQPLIFNNLGNINALDTNILNTSSDIYYEGDGEIIGNLGIGVDSPNVLKHLNYYWDKNWLIKYKSAGVNLPAEPYQLRHNRTGATSANLNTIITSTNKHEHLNDTLQLQYDCPYDSSTRVTKDRRILSRIIPSINTVNTSVYLCILNNCGPEDGTWIELIQTNHLTVSNWSMYQKPGTYFGSPGTWQLIPDVQSSEWYLQFFDNTSNDIIRFAVYNPQDNEYRSLDTSSFPIDNSYYISGAENSADMLWVTSRDTTSPDFIISYKAPEALPTDYNEDLITNLKAVHRVDIDETGKTLQLEWSNANNYPGLMYKVEYTPYKIPRVDPDQTVPSDHRGVYTYIVPAGSWDGSQTNNIISIQIPEDNLEDNYTEPNQVKVTPFSLYSSSNTPFNARVLTNTFPTISYEQDSKSGVFKISLEARTDTWTQDYDAMIPTTGLNYNVITRGVDMLPGQGYSGDQTINNKFLFNDLVPHSITAKSIAGVKDGKHHEIEWSVGSITRKRKFSLEEDWYLNNWRLNGAGWPLDEIIQPARARKYNWSHIRPYELRSSSVNWEAMIIRYTYINGGWIGEGSYAYRPGSSIATSTGRQFNSFNEGVTTIFFENLHPSQNAHVDLSGEFYLGSDDGAYISIKVDDLTNGNNIFTPNSLHLALNQTLPGGDVAAVKGPSWHNNRLKINSTYYRNFKAGSWTIPPKTKFAFRFVAALRYGSNQYEGIVVKQTKLKLTEYTDV